MVEAKPTQVDVAEGRRFDEVRRLQGLRRAILAPAVVLMLLLAIGVPGLISMIMEARSREETRRLADESREAFRMVMDSEARFMAANLDQLLARPDVTGAWRAGDMNRLYEVVEPAFRRLAAAHGVSRIHFIDLQGREKLRVQKRFGTTNDVYETTTLHEAQRNKRDAWGLELGPLAHFAPRYVRVWMLDGVPAGYVLMGTASIPPERIAERLRLHHDAGYLVVVREDYVTDLSFDSRREVAGPKGADFGEFVVASGTLKELPYRLRTHLARPWPGAELEVFSLKADGREWSCHDTVLYGPGGQPLADLVVLRDTASETMQRNRILYTVCGGLVLLSAVLLLLLWWYAGRSVAELSSAIRRREQDYDEKVRINAELAKSKEELAAVNARLVQANQSKGEFLASISHEIRTPLNAIIGFSEILLSEVRNPKQAEYVRSMRVAGEGLLKLINDILDLSKIEAGRMEVHPAPMDLRSMLREVQQLFAHSCAMKKLSLRLEIDPDVPSVLMLDEVRLRQILFNLVGNAVKFTHKGSVFVHAWQMAGAIGADEIELNISVCDTGIGIPEDQRALVFEAFQQQRGQSPVYGGTGLGLAICRRLLSLMDGRIELRSEVGVGSDFRIVIERVKVVRMSRVTAPKVGPSVQRPAAVGSAAAPAAQAAPGGAEAWPNPTPEQVRAWGELARVLRTHYASETAQLRERLNVNRANELARRIAALAQKYDAPMIVSWAEALCHCAECFDVEQMRSMLARFDSLVERLAVAAAPSLSQSSQPSTPRPPSA